MVRGLDRLHGAVVSSCKHTSAEVTRAWGGTNDCEECNFRAVEEMTELLNGGRTRPRVEHHTDGRPCWCQPAVEQGLDGDIVIHRTDAELP